MVLLLLSVLILFAQAAGLLLVLGRLGATFFAPPFDPLVLIAFSWIIAGLGLLFRIAWARPIAIAALYVNSGCMVIAVYLAAAQKILGPVVQAFTKALVIRVTQLPPETFADPTFKNPIYIAAGGLFIFGLLSNRLQAYLRNNKDVNAAFWKDYFFGREFLILGLDVRVPVIVVIWFALVYPKILANLELVEPQSLPNQEADKNVKPPPGPTLTIVKEVSGWQFSADLKQAMAVVSGSGAFRLDLLNGQISTTPELRKVTAFKPKLSRALSGNLEVYFNSPNEIANLKTGAKETILGLGERTEPVFLAETLDSVLIYDEASKTLKAYRLPFAPEPLWELSLAQIPIDSEVIRRGEISPNNESMLIRAENVFYVINFVTKEIIKLDQDPLAFSPAYSKEGDVLIFSKVDSKNEESAATLNVQKKEVVATPWLGRTEYASSVENIVYIRYGSKLIAWALNAPAESLWEVQLPTTTPGVPAVVSADGALLIVFELNEYFWLPLTRERPTAEFKRFKSNLSRGPRGYFQTDRKGHLLAHMRGLTVEVFWLRSKQEDRIVTRPFDFSPHLNGL